MTATLCCLAVLALAGDSAWPGFLGAGATPIDAATIPLHWSAQQNTVWRAEIPGHGQSSPVVWQGTIYVTSVEGPEKEFFHLQAIRLSDGKILWKHSVDSSEKVKNSLYVSRAAPTPVVDAVGVYTFFESGDVVCVSHQGQPLWRQSLSTVYGKFQNRHGVAASPVQTDEAVIILLDDAGPSYLVALRKSDGAVLWKTDRTSRTSWSSPWLVPVQDRSHVVCSSAGSVDGYDPTDGRLLWSYSGVGGNTMATPMAYAPGRFLVGASAGREAEAARAEDARKSNFAMQIELVEGQPVPRVLWKTEQATPSFGSPMVHAGHAYWVNRTGVVYCFDARTGQPCYTERIKQSCWATPLGIGDRVYFFGKDGLTTVLAAGPKFQVLAENMLWNPDDVPPNPALAAAETPEQRAAAPMFSAPIQYGVAAIDDSLLIRTGEKLFCIRSQREAK